MGGGRKEACLPHVVKEGAEDQVAECHRGGATLQGQDLTCIGEEGGVIVESGAGETARVNAERMGGRRLLDCETPCP